MTGARRPAPGHLDELRVRAEALRGRSIGEIAAALGVRLDGDPVRTKGRVGDLIERALGADPGSAAGPDFAALGVELKTVPLDERGWPAESTWVCALRLDIAENARWEDALPRRKLAHVLFVPVAPGANPGARLVGAPCFFRPTAAQEAVLRSDFEQALETIALDGVEALDARAGRWLQVRPKAATGRVRTLGPGGDGVPVETVPRGFYLRSRFVGAILADPLATPA